MIGILVSQSSYAQPSIKLVANDGGTQDQFGGSVSIDGTTLIAGANLNDEVAEDAGAAYIFQQDGSAWSLLQKLTNANGEAGDGFGISVDVHGRFAAVGALGDNEKGDNAGAVYIYQQQGATWVEHAKITADDGSPNDGFGFAVALYNNLLLVGARGVDTNGNSAGAAYLFFQSDDQWVQFAKLLPGDGSSGDFFGTSVDINESYAIISAVLADGEEAGAGAVYVFENRGAIWLETQKLTAASGKSLDQFGISISMHGSNIVVGAASDDDRGIDGGAAYVFTQTDTGFQEITKLVATDSANEDFFGRSVAIEASYAVVGAPGADKMGAGAGAAYLFELSDEGWDQVRRLDPDSNTSGGGFGNAVAVNEGAAVLGAWEDAAIGAVYVYDVSSVLTSREPVLVTPETFSELLVYPNPFVDQLSVSFELKSPAHVRINIYDTLGREVGQFFDRVLGQGMHQLRLPNLFASSGHIPKGGFFLKIEAGGVFQTQMIFRL